MQQSKQDAAIKNIKTTTGNDVKIAIDKLVAEKTKKPINK